MFIFGYLDVWASLCFNDWIINVYCMGVWMFKCLGVWMFDCWGVWMFNSLGAWMFECMNVWMYTLPGLYNPYSLSRQ